MSAECRKCGLEFEPTPHHVSKSDWICKPYIAWALGSYVGEGKSPEAVCRFHRITLDDFDRYRIDWWKHYDRGLLAGGERSGKGDK